MGKNKKKTLQEGGDSQYSKATVFVSNLPFSFTNSQLEEAFSDVGPIRRCFMVTKKGETGHRGIGFVQFATAEDVNRAIELKNGSSVGGRKIGLKRAMHRAPLEQRRSKGDQVAHADGVPESTNSRVDIPSEVVNEEQDQATIPQELEKNVVLERKSAKDDNQEQDQVTIPQKLEKNARKHDKANAMEIGKSASDNQEQDQVTTPQKIEKSVRKHDKAKVMKGGKSASDEKSSSETQRIARTVIFGGLRNAGMAESVHQKAKQCGSVLSIIYPLSKDELGHHGLRQDGCQMDASSVLFTSVQSARACVALLHQKEISGGIVWARQLGGEGANTQKWKLIVRNLPFKARGIKELFSSVGFVWDVIFPQNDKQRFAFVKYTCKQDAEMAIKKFNGTKLGRRPIAVDWAIPKKIYATGGALPLSASEEGQSGSDEEDDDMSTDREKDDDDMDEILEDSDMGDVPGESDQIEEQRKLDFDKEAYVAKKVLDTLISKGGHMSPDDISAFPSSSNKDNGIVTVPTKSFDGAAKSALDIKPGSTGKTESDTQEDLQRTLFISNLPFDVNTDEVKQRFSAFGEVQSFFPVLHPVTKRPKGTGFLKFKTIDAADAAFSAASAVAGLGIILKGRQLKVMKALNKESAHNKEVEKTKKEDHDHRNLYLAKEGLIVEGTPAAQGVSAADILKRQTLERTKAMKLQSPNFHVSRTRLIIYNLPKSMTDKQLKRHCIDAVISRATKQKPVIRQIKFLQDSKKGKVVTKNHSRGVAFVEFTEHEHALVALRVLNNNPETFGPEHRPIVEFALDNIQTLKQRQEKIQYQQQLLQQQGSHQDAKNMQQHVDSHLPDGRSNMSRKHTSRGDIKSSKTLESTQQNKVEHEVLEGADAEEGKHNKRHKPSPKKWEKKSDSKENHREEVRRPYGRKPNDGGSLHAVGEGATRESRPMREADEGMKKRKLQDQTGHSKEDFGSNQRKKTKKNKDPLGRDTEDKLDMLIKQYTSKFSQRGSGKAEGENQGPPRQLKRWFQS